MFSICEDDVKALNDSFTPRLYRFVRFAILLEIPERVLSHNSFALLKFYLIIFHSTGLENVSDNLHFKVFYKTSEQQKADCIKENMISVIKALSKTNPLETGRHYV